MKGKLSTVLLVIVFLFGLSLLIYPSFSNYWNSFHMTSVISNYEKLLDDLDDDTYERLYNSAVSYNQLLSTCQTGLTLPPDRMPEYEKQLDISGDGLMGYIEIESINVYIPIYHGTEESAMTAGVGHLSGSSLPIGGESSHSVICGHRGLPTAKLFTDLDRLNVGDEFTLYILGNAYTYEVCDIFIIEPDDASKLFIEEGKDLCTLFTCTPYGINSHRLLVRGERIDSNNAHIRVTSEAYKIDSYIAAPIFAVPLLFIFLIWLIFSTGKKKKGGDDTDE